jgi:hypothetical protein
MSEHTCHALGCEKAVPPKLFMCRDHWFMIPKAERDALWAVYVPGQERRKDPTQEYVTVARRLQVLVADKEGVPVPPMIRRRAEGPISLDEAGTAS